jgi:hypothetical protein
MQLEWAAAYLSLCLINHHSSETIPSAPLITPPPKIHGLSRGVTVQSLRQVVSFNFRPNVPRHEGRVATLTFVLYHFGVQHGQWDNLNETPESCSQASLLSQSKCLSVPLSLKLQWYCYLSCKTARWRSSWPLMSRLYRVSTSAQQIRGCQGCPARLSCRSD